MTIRAGEDIVRSSPPARHLNVPRSHPANVIGRDKLVTVTGGLLSLLRPRRRRRRRRMAAEPRVHFSYLQPDAADVTERWETAGS